MPLGIFELLSELEVQIAQLYGRMKIISKLKQYFDSFSLMEEISYDHSEKINDIVKKYTIASFDRSAFIKIHDKIKNKLWESVIQEDDENKILKKMSESEESVGKLYFAVSAYFKKLSDQYKQISLEMDKIANDEFDHKDLLLNLIK